MRGRIALLLATLALCAIASELVLRAMGFGRPLIHEYDPELLWRMPANTTAHAPSYDVTYRTNSRGWRDDEIPPERRPGELRILALGDSVLFGQGVPSEETFAERLEALLAEASPFESVEVINAGVSGYGVFQYRKIVAAVVPEHHPDLVLLLFVKNDVLSADDIEELRQNALHGRQANVDTPLSSARRASALVHAFSGVAQRLVPASHAPRALRYDQSRISPEQWAQAIAELDEMVDALDGWGIPLVVVALPLAREVREGGIEVPLEPLEQLAASRGFPLLSLGPAFSALPAEARESLFLDAVHPSARGHEVAARAVAAYLSERGLVH